MRRRRILVVLGTLAGGLHSAAVRAETPWWMGQTVGMVSLEATDGGLPGENLEPLLNVRQGGSLSPRDVRADLAMLQEVGAFAAVEAHVEAWVIQDEEQNPAPAVRMEYRVIPPPRIRRIRAEGVEGMSRREVLSISGLARGDPFFPSQAVPATEARIGAWFAKNGWPSARVTVEVVPLEGRQVDVRIAVEAGQAQRLAAVKVRRMPRELGRKADRALHKAGVSEGDPFNRDAMLAGREALLDLLESEGYPEARVRDVLQPAGEGSLDREVVYVVDPGRRVEVEIRGLAGNRKQTRRAVARDLGHRISEEIVEEAEDRIAKDLAGRGWFAADVEIRTEDRPRARAILVSVDRGRRHKLEEVRFLGATAFPDAYLEAAMREANPEVLGRGWVTPEALDQALAALTEFYRSQGFLSARLERTSIQRLERKRGHVPVVVEVEVQEGPRTWLSALAVENDPGPAVGILDERAGDLLGRPLNPAATDALAREITTACWEEGYLSADVTVQRDLSLDASAATARFVITPGPRVVLRNVLVQGLRHTRRSVVERETRLETGEPVTPSALARTRRGLYDLGLFQKVDAELVGDEDRVKDLVLFLEEAPRTVLDAGGGASTDQGARMFLRATHRNLWGLAHRIAAVGQFGLAWFGDSWWLDTTRPEWYAGFRYTAPDVPVVGRQTFLDVLLNEERQHPTWRLARTGGGPGMETEIGERGRFVFDYRVEWRRIEDLDPGALVEGDPWLALLDLPEQTDASGLEAPYDPDVTGEAVLPSGWRTTSGPQVLLVLDDRDDPENPRRGVRFSVQARIADGMLGSAPLAVARTQAVGLVPLGPLGLLLGVQAGAGTTLSPGTLPLDERFHVGGAGSIRGFERDSLGPANRAMAYDPGYPSEIEPFIRYAQREDPYRWVATGGDAMLVMTGEIKVPLPVFGLHAWEAAALVGFVDVGNAYFLRDVHTSSSSAEHDPPLRLGTGLGLRYATPIGPLQLDLGVNPFPIVGRDEAPLRVHLSLGAF